MMQNRFPEANLRHRRAIPLVITSLQDRLVAVLGVKNLVSLSLQGLTQEFVIQSLNDRILVALA